MIMYRFRIKLLHGYCSNILREAYCDSVKIQLLDVCSKLKQEFKLLPEKYSIVHAMEKEENNFDQYEIIQNIRDNGTIKDIFAVPSADEIIKLDSYTAEEMSDMLREFNGLNFKVTSAFEKELDGVVRSNEDYGSADAYHQPHFTQANDLEESIRDMNTHDDLNNLLNFETFTFKLLSYYSMLYRVFKLEYFTTKSSAKALDILHLERYVYNGSDYWKMNEKAEIDVKNEPMDFEIYSDSDDSRSNDNLVSKAIIKQIVTQKRRRGKLQDDLENLYEGMMTFKNSVEALQEKSFDKILEYISLYHENRFQNVIHCLNKTLEKIYNTQVDESQVHGIVKQVHSLHSLKKRLANKDRKITPWFNYRYFQNYAEFDLFTHPVLNDEAMSPDQIELLKSLYPETSFSKNVFSGQKMLQPYSCLDCELLDLPHATRSYILSSSNTMKGFVNDYLEIFKLSNKKDADNLSERNDLLKSFVLRAQLKEALFTWYTREEYPLTPYQYKMLGLKFRDNLYKKMYNQKTSYQKSIEGIVGHHKLDTMSEEAMGVLTPLQQEELKVKRTQALTKYTLVDQVSQTKAE